MNEERKMQLLRVLEEARNVVNNGQEISTEFARVYFRQKEGSMNLHTMVKKQRNR